MLFRRQTFFRYAVTVAAVCLAAVLRAAFDPFQTWKTPFVFFVLAIILLARYGGLGTGVTATVPSVGGIEFFVG
jgi:hypothetical protein